MDVLYKVVLGVVAGLNKPEQIVSELNLPEREVRKVLDELEKKGIITISEDNIELKANLKEVVNFVEDTYDGITVLELGLPFKATLGVGNASRYLVIPMYIIRTINPAEDSIAVLKIGDMSVSGHIGKRRNLFYIHKKYWSELGLNELEGSKEVDVVFEKLIKPSRR